MLSFLGGLFGRLFQALVGGGVEMWREDRRDKALVQRGHDAGEIARLKKTREIHNRAMQIEGASPADLTDALRDL